MGGLFLPADFLIGVLLAIVEPHDNFTIPFHKEKGTYSDFEVQSAKTHPP